MEDDYYRCPDGVTRAFRVRDMPTTQPCKSSPTSNALGYHVGINVNGLFVATCNTLQGKIKVNLPDDMAAGDTVSGTVNVEPAGQNESERGRNNTELNGYVIEVGGQKTSVNGKTLPFMIPLTITPTMKLMTISNKGQMVCTSELPISNTPQPAPSQFTIPTGGQAGNPLEIKGPFKGVFSPDDFVKIGGSIAPPLAESPRKIVVQDTSNMVGPTKIECQENGSTTECPFRNIEIKLSAPKLDLIRGERTTLHIVVSGLAGITKDLPLQLVNQSPGIINMNGGVTQNIAINPSAVPPNGTWSIDRPLTGIQAGSFNITGTVTWDDTCNGAGPIAAAGGPAAQPTPPPAPTPLTPTDTASGEVCKWINYRTYRVDEFKRVDSTNSNLEVRNGSAHGGGTAVEFHCKAAGTFIFTVTKDDGTKDVVSVTCTQP